MPSRLVNAIIYVVSGYLLADLDDNRQYRARDEIEPDTPEYFTWLASLKSFHFEGQYGRFTARLESRKNKDGSTREYWSAYRKHNKKQLRRYLGATDKLTISTLEAAARHLTDVCTSQPVKVKQPRKKVESRAILYARLKIQEQAIDQLLAEKEALESELTALKLEKARWIVQSRDRLL